MVVSIHPFNETTSPTNDLTGVPQPSVAVTKARSGAGTTALHPRASAAGQVMLGGVTSVALNI